MISTTIEAPESSSAPTDTDRRIRTLGLTLIGVAGLLAALWIALNASDLSGPEVRALTLLPALAVGVLLGAPTYACRKRPSDHEHRSPHH